MLNTIIRWLKGYVRVGALHIDVQKDGQWKMHAAIVFLKKNKIELESFFVEVPKDELAALPLKDLPVSVLVTGRGNINKKTGAEVSKLNDVNAALQLVFPNAKLLEFAVDYAPASEGYLISAIRQDQLQEQILGVLEENSIQYVSAQAGFVPLLRWYEQVADKITHIDAAGFRLLFQNNKLKTIQPLAAEDISTEVEVLQKRVPGLLLPALLCAIELLAGSGSNLSVQSNAVAVVAEERYRYKQMVKNTGMLASGVFFVVLLFNFMLFSSYKSEYEQLRYRETGVLSVVNKLKSIEKELKEKKTFLKTAGWVNASKSSWYCDQLIIAMPSGISLLELSVNPYDVPASRKEKQLVFKSGQILVRGLCSNPVKVNEWAKQLDQQQWISNVSIDKYTKDSKSGLSEFYLTVMLYENY